MLTKQDGTDIVDSILKTIKDSTNAIVNDIQCDKTFDAKILKKLENEKYRILLNGRTYDNIPSPIGVSYSENEMVEARANQGNMDTLKLITQTISDTGTSIVVGGIPQSVVSFTSDPQSQLDTKLTSSNIIAGTNITVQTVGKNVTINSTGSITEVGTLNTNNSTAQVVPTIPESFSSAINLHKISKTGNYNDLAVKATKEDILLGNVVNELQYSAVNPPNLISSIWIEKAGLDLNSIITAGFYHNPSSAIASTQLNCPTTMAYKMQVYGASSHMLAVLTEYIPVNPKRWFRNYYNGTWGKWYRMYTEANNPTPAEVGLSNLKNVDQTNASNLTSGLISNNVINHNPKAYSMNPNIMGSNGVATFTDGANPSLAELAVVNNSFSNKIQFYDPNLITFEKAETEENWTEISVSETEKKRFVSENNNAAISIPSKTYGYRMTIKNDGTYVFLSAVNLTFLGYLNQISIMVEYQNKNSADWIVNVPRTNSGVGYPGNLWMTIPQIRFAQNAFSDKIRITFLPTWNDNDINPCVLMGLAIYGGYPFTPKKIYSWDENKNVSFPSRLSAQTLRATIDAILPSATSIGTVSSEEISYLDGVTSNIQSQLNNGIPFVNTLPSNPQAGNAVWLIVS